MLFLRRDNLQFEEITTMILIKMIILYVLFEFTSAYQHLYW